MLRFACGSSPPTLLLAATVVMAVASGMVVYNLADGGHKNAITSVVRLSPSSEVCVMWCRSRKGAARGQPKYVRHIAAQLVFLTF